MNQSANERPVPKKEQGQFIQVWKRFRRSKTAMVALIIIILLILTAIFADVLVDYDTQVVAQNSADRLMKPCAQHLLGADQYGRDILARIVYGSRMSLTIGIGTTIISLLLGAILGSIAGFFGGKLDAVISRIVDALMCIPATLMALCIIATLGSGLINIMIAITISQVPAFTRLIRSVIMTLRDKDYVEAARACGTSNLRIITRHVLPNALGPIIVQGTMSMADMMLTAAGLGFLGMGIAPPMPEWGTMLSEGREFIRSASHLVTFPGIAIVLAALCFNLLGDGLRDALDPNLKN